MAYLTCSDNQFRIDDYCSSCKHYTKDEKTETWGCPITDIHFLFDHKGKLGEIMDYLLPEHYLNGFQCTMRIEKNEIPKNQLRLELEYKNITKK